jgi:hypothetical protein
MAMGIDFGFSTEVNEISGILPFGLTTSLAVPDKISPLSTPLWITSKREKQTLPNLSLPADVQPLSPRLPSLSGSPSKVMDLLLGLILG